MEYYDILDEDGTPTGSRAGRREVHARGLLHGAAHLWIFNSRGDLLLQLRAPGKDSHPGLWDISVAGHIDAGEGPESAAVREAREELGLAVRPGELLPHGKRTSLLVSGDGGFIDREISWVFLLHCEKPVEQFVLQSVEVSRVRWFGREELLSALDEPMPAGFLVPHDRSYYLDVLERVRREAGLH
ncbi:MAG: NUDIX hydrolase [Spirochaetota bacterium]